MQQHYLDENLVRNIYNVDSCRQGVNFSALRLHQYFVIEDAVLVSETLRVSLLRCSCTTLMRILCVINLYCWFLPIVYHCCTNILLLQMREVGGGSISVPQLRQYFVIVESRMAGEVDFSALKLHQYLVIA